MRESPGRVAATASVPSAHAMTLSSTLLRSLALLVALAPAQDDPRGYGAIFDEHWENLRDAYPYFERYGVDWEAERAEHRPRAAAARNPSELAWEIARLLSVLKDTHTEYMPPIKLMQEWAIPDVETTMIGRRPHLLSLGEGLDPIGPERYREDPRAYPEIVSVRRTPMGCGTVVLVAGPLGTDLELRLRWPDGSETDEIVPRPKVCNLPPPRSHFGERWIVSGRVGSIGYLRVKTFSPDRATLGPAGKMTPILREHLQGLLDTEGLILDVQGNGGGVVGASDPFLSHFLEERVSYQWGNADGAQRVLVPRSPRYGAPVVVIVDDQVASGGEWAARILRDAGRAEVIGGRTLGAEAAVQRCVASDGSHIQHSAWPMAEPGVEPFQDRGVTLDHPLLLTIEAARELDIEAARTQVRRARFAKALKVLGAPAEDLDALVALADDADRAEEAGPSDE